ncbi:Pycsar system effector family protein [Spongiactinospora sp. 9N601]|uniref:Pycsar system effector family protein n=1 Tax=Spongiactinospora sp. 9N601 TaxID=3375149 RepID=UPI0037932090
MLTADVSAELEARASAARAELARTDGKAGQILAVAGTAGTLLIAVVAAARPTGVAGAGLATASALLAAAVVAALRVVRPRLPRGQADATGVIADALRSGPHAVLTSAQTQHATAYDRAADVHRLAQIAHRKYRLLRRADDLVVAAVAIAAASGLLTVLGL